MLKFNSKPVSEHSEVSLADDGALEKVVEHWSAREASTATLDRDSSACYVVSVGTDRDPIARAAQLAEIVALVQHQGGHIVGQELCQLTRPHPRTLLGTGTARAIADRARASGATMLMAKYTANPFSKLEYFKEGKTLLENAIASNKNDIELRFLRCAIQENLPAFLDYNDNLDEDKNYIMKYMPMMDKKDVRKAIATYMIKSERTTETEKTSLKRYE